MLGIQNQSQVRATNPVSFKSHEDYEHYKTGDISPDSFNREDIESERDAKVDQINQSKADLDSLADELENSDSKVSKKAGKGLRVAATIMGLVGTFVMAKYSSKLVIETLKNAANSPAVKSTTESLKGLKEPAGKAIDGMKSAIGKLAKNPSVQNKINAIKNSRAGQTIVNFVKNEKVASVLKPIRETLKSISEIKINGKSIQNGVENIMAATTTGSVLVDNLAGRNNDKSNVELATGM